MLATLIINYDVMPNHFLIKMSSFCQKGADFYWTIMAGSDLDILETLIFMQK